MSEENSRRRAVTSFDVAKAAGVSRASVSRAYTAGARISPELRAHVLEVADRIGYSVNRIARGLNKQRSDLVGVIVSRLDNPYRSRQVEALTTVLAREGYRPLLFCIEPDEPVEATLRLLLDYQVSGVVITSGAPDDRIVEECAGQGVPLILVDRPDTAAGPVDHVRGENAAGGRLVGEAFSKAGRRRVVAFRPERITFSLGARIDSLGATCGELGLGFSVEPMPGYDYEAGFAAVSQFLAGDPSLPPPGEGALFLPNDVTALGGLDAIRQRGLGIPGDLALMGYDDIDQAGWAGTQLSTVRQDAAAVAQAVVALLKRRIGAPECPQRTIDIPVTLRLRASH